MKFANMVCLWIFKLLFVDLVGLERKIPSRHNSQDYLRRSSIPKLEYTSQAIINQGQIFIILHSFCDPTLNLHIQALNSL